jgi:AcrR family transcriptional regulator/DNA-binding MarR family transcriptional regulator
MRCLSDAGRRPRQTGGRPQTPNHDHTPPGRLSHNGAGSRHERLVEEVPHERVAGIQRARMLSAMAEVCAERGADNVTVAHVVARSGVSRRTFYEQFADRQDCLLAAFDAAVERIAARVLCAYERHERWRDRVRAALHALLAFLDEYPSVGDLVVVQVLGAGPQALERRQRILARIAAAVDGGRGESRRGAEPPPLTAEGVVGAVFSVVHARMVQEGHRPLVELVNPLMSMIALPYLGAAAARRELARPVPKSGGSARAGLSSLRDLEMRLTYRTVRVLLAIGANPEGSNRQVADAAGIHDQGQVSKLLWRLEDLGLIRNAIHAPVKGEPNAWTLTERGASVREAISAQTPPS